MGYIEEYSIEFSIEEHELTLKIVEVHKIIADIEVQDLSIAEIEME